MTIDKVLAEKRLNHKREEISAFLTAAKEATATVELDQQSVGRLSRMDAMQQQAMAKSHERQRLMDLQRIDAAFRRIEDGTYGYCADCEEEIPDRRLEIDPMALRCVSCSALS